MPLPPDSPPDSQWALEPRLDSPVNKNPEVREAWPPAQEVSSIAGSIRITNITPDPITINKHDQFCQVTPILEAKPHVQPPDPVSKPTPPNPPFSEAIQVDPDNILPNDIRHQFHQLHLQYDNVFNPAIPRYNGASGDIKAVVNVGDSLPPPTKGPVTKLQQVYTCRTPTKV